VPIGFQLPFFSSDETRLRIAGNKVVVGSHDGAVEAPLDTNMSQGTMSTLATLGREMREIQMLAAAESLADTTPADVSVLIKNGDNDDTSHASTITHATFNSSVAGFDALSQALTQQSQSSMTNTAALSMILQGDPLATITSRMIHQSAPSSPKTHSRKTNEGALSTTQVKAPSSPITKSTMYITSSGSLTDYMK
jgi:hypothetical protein